MLLFPKNILAHMVLTLTFCSFSQQKPSLYTCPLTPFSLFPTLTLPYSLYLSFLVPHVLSVILFLSFSLISLLQTLHLSLIWSLLFSDPSPSLTSHFLSLSLHVFPFFISSSLSPSLTIQSTKF